MKRLFTYTVLVLAVAQLLLILLSWLLSATMTEDVRSLLSDEGIRWFFGEFVSQLASPLLVWMVLLSMAYGCISQSHLLDSLHLKLQRAQFHSYRSRIALRTTIVIFIIYILLIAALTLAPHAMLLSSTGKIFPSPFSRAFVPIVSFGIIVCSSAYGFTSGHFKSLDSLTDSLTSGIAKAAPLFLLYVLCSQLVASLCFVFL